MIRFGYSVNRIDAYLARAFDLVDYVKVEGADENPVPNLVTNVILLKNVRDLVVSRKNCLLLATTGNMYEVEAFKMLVPEELESHIIWGANQTLIKIADNVKEIGDK